MSNYYLSFSQPRKKEWLVHLVARVLEWLRLCHELIQEMAEAIEQQQVDAEGPGQGSLIIDFQPEGESIGVVEGEVNSFSPLSLCSSVCLSLSPSLFPLFHSPLSLPLSLSLPSSVSPFLSLPPSLPPLPPSLPPPSLCAY